MSSNKSYKHSTLLFFFTICNLLIEAFCDPSKNLLTLAVILLNRVAQTDINKNIITNTKGSTNIFSSLEGHALLLLQGYGFMNLQSASLSCVFTDMKTSTMIYKSVVQTAQTTCDSTDYTCQYWQTSYSFSDNQIGCFTPKIPEGDRNTLMTTTNNWASMRISLQISQGMMQTSLTCPFSFDCNVVYHNNYTPSLYTFSPAHFYIGQNLIARIYPKQNSIATVLSVKIGRNNCNFSTPTKNDNNWNELNMNCQTGDSYLPEKVTDFNINFNSGFASVPSFFLKDDVDLQLANNKSKFYFKVFPRIDSISSIKGVTNGGQTITIKGAGFISGRSKVFIDTYECTQDLNVVSLNTISCTTPPVSFDPSKTTYTGSNGLRWRVYNLTSSGSISAMNSLAGFPDNTTVLMKDDIILETMTGPTLMTNYGQFFNGWFKALYSGSYRFWMTSDDASQFWLSTDSTAVKKVKLIDFGSWANYNDFVTPNLLSAFVDLTAGQMYYMEVKHAQGSGADHFSLGVEIKTSGVDTALVSPLPNQISRIVQMTIAPTSARDIYEFVINSTVADTYKLTCKSADGTTTKTVNIDPTTTASNFIIVLKNLIGEGQLLVRKVGYNSVKQYYLAKETGLDDASYTTGRIFSNMYLGDPALSTTVSDGPQTGYVFLVMIDRKQSQRTYAWENNCFLSTTANPTILLSKKQNVSPEMTGTFGITVTDNNGGDTVNIPNVDITSLNYLSIQNSLSVAASLINKFTVYYSTSALEATNIYIRMDKSINVSINFTSKSIVGGVGTPTYTVSDLVPSSQNLFFYPTPADFLFVSNPLPQVRVVSNGFEAACRAGKCSYSYIDSTTLPSVTAATFNQDTNAVSVTLSAALSSLSDFSPSITVGVSPCGLPLSFDSTTNTFTCTLTNPIVTGSYLPNVGTKHGNLIQSETLQTITIGMTITSVYPNKVNSNGGSVITITGTGFPVQIDGNLLIQMGDSNCGLQSLTNTVVTCVTSSQTGPEPLTITYNSASVQATTAQFQFVTSTNPPPNLISMTPNSLAPGNKQDVSIQFDSDISSFSLTTITVKLVHRTVRNYVIMMNPKSVTTDTLVVRYGGAMKGQYNLYVNLDASTFAAGSLTPTVGITLYSVTPNVGSMNGGTVLTLTGVNFLPTAVNQIVFIGSTQCTATATGSTSITCVTSPPNTSTLADVSQQVVVEQMIQHDSECNGQCLFTYSSSLTATVNSIQSANNDSYFGIDDTITISGSNFNYAKNPNKLSFDWGEITVTEGDSNTVLKGTVSLIKNYGVLVFKFYNDYGLATHKLSGAGLITGDNNIYIALKKPTPQITAISPSPASENGAIFSLLSTMTDFTTLSTNSITICGKPCTVLPTNLIPSTNNNFQCYINYKIYQTEFAGCPIVLYYYGIQVPLSSGTTVSSSNAVNYQIQSIDTSLITSSPNSFAIKVMLTTNMKDFAGLRMIVDNRYTVKSDPGTLVNNKAVYSFNFPNGLPSGRWTGGVHEDTVGFIAPPSALALKDANGKTTNNFVLNIPSIINASASDTTSSFYGGMTVEIGGSNFNKLITGVDPETVTKGSAFQSVTVCGIPASIVESCSKYIKFLTPTVLKYDIFSTTNAMSADVDLFSLTSLVESYFDASTTTFTNLLDNNPYTGVPTTTSNTGFTFFGVKLKSSVAPNFKIMLKKVKIFVGQSSMPGDFNSGRIEGSNDGTTWTLITTLPQNLPFLWYTINISNSAKALYSYIRLVPNANSQIAELRFFGFVVYDSTATTLTCAVTLSDTLNNVVVNNLNVKYDQTQTYSISSISPNHSTSLGAADVTFTLAKGNQLTGTEKISVKIYGNAVTSQIVITGASATSPPSFTLSIPARSSQVYDVTSPLTINIDSIGNVYSDLFFTYLDRWSNPATWGGEYIPANGETAFITNTNVLLDVPVISLNTLVVENGSLIVEDSRDYQLSALNILIQSGQFTVGTETQPFSHKFVLTMKSSKTDPTLPIFGNKVLAVLEGKLDMHGLVRTPTYTLLTKTTKAGDSTIAVLGPVDWTTGDQIVIASSSVHSTEAEMRWIVSVTGGSSQSPVLTLDSSLAYLHYGDLETYGTSDTIDMRAEVILLTRNVVVQGDDSSEQQQYGSHIMLTAMNMNMNTAGRTLTSGKLSYIETRRAGQAFQLGRYPIHFHMIGDINGSYVKGCSIHNTYNRAVTIHGVTNFLVDSNVAYNVMGHTFFIEDAVETNNIIRNNVGMMTRSSSSLLNTDYNPATFWITNPSNFFENNRAAGSEFYGFWMDLPIAPTGLNLGVAGCPREMPLGSFINNFSHSNGQYGVRIFPEFNPKSKPCQPVDGVNVVTVQALFQGITTYRNGERGFITELIGNLVFEGFKTADNVVSSMEISRIFPLAGGTFTSSPVLTTIIQNSFIVGTSRNPNGGVFTTYGLIAPRADRLLVNNIRFYSFATPGSALISSCSRCEVSDASTDSDARTNYFSNIKSDGSQVMNVKWAQPRRAIFRDLDGSLTGSSGPAWASPYYPHNLAKECTRNPKFDDGIICDDTVQIRRVAFSEAGSQFSGQNMRIVRLPGNANSVTPMILADTAQFSVLPFKEKTSPENGWAVPFVTGYNYMASFGSKGLDFASLVIERSFMWSNNDKPININFNYTYRRDAFNITGADNNNKIYTVNNITDLAQISSVTAGNNNLPSGSFYNNLDTKNLYVRINGLNPANYVSNLLTITAIQCYNNNCGITPPSANAENFVRRWSNASNWPNNLVPTDGGSPVIPPQWNMILDVSTANLQNLTVYGNLTWDPNGHMIELKANNILNMGTISIGSSDTRYSNTARLTLTGNRFIPNIALSNNVQIPNKALINVGLISIYGIDRSPYSTKLLSVSKAGDISIQVANSLNWKAGDEILITTTSYYNNQTERFFIASYSNTAGILTLSSPLIYAHYGGSSSTAFADSPLNPPVNLDERADVYMITRNVKISGSNEGWGCNVITTKYQTADFLYAGRTNISDAEVTGCGQTDTSFSAIHFEAHNAVTSFSYLNGLSLHDNFYSGINVVKSSNVNLNSIVGFNLIKYGVYVMNSVNVTLTDVNIVAQLNRTMPPSLATNMNVDSNACFYICPESNTCQNVQVSNSTCAGSQFFGFMMDSNDCSVDLITPYPSYNRVYATQIGVVPFNGQGRACTKYGNVISYHNLVGYAYNSNSDLTIHENILSANDIQGVIILSASKNEGVRKRLSRALIVGQNRDNPVCADTSLCTRWTCTQQAGFTMSASGNGKSNTLPLVNENFPLNEVKADASFGSFFDAFNVTFANWEDQCPINNFAITSNALASDFISIHNIRNMTLSRVLEDNFIYFNNLDNSVVNDKNQPCGDFPCTGPNTALFKVTSFNPSGDSQDSSNLKVNPKWTAGSSNPNANANNNDNNSNSAGIKKYLIPNFVDTTPSSPNKPTYNVFDGTTFFVSKPFGPLNGCTSVGKWNSLTCNTNRKMGILTFQNVDAEANTRSIAPVYVSDLDPYETFNNKLNSFMDHSCQFGYPSHLRTPIFPSLVTLNKSYQISFTSTNPKNIKFQLQDTNWDNGKHTFNSYSVSSRPPHQVPDGILVSLHYPSPVTVLVYNLASGGEVQSKVWKLDEDFDVTARTCGMSKWTAVKNTLQFYITNSPDCILMLKPSNSVQLSLRLDMSVTDFYSKQDNMASIYKIAAVLGIPTEQIRITGVNQGSTVVNLNILESKPETSITSSDPSAPSAATVNLDTVISTMVSKIKDGSLPLPAPVLDLKYQLLRTVDTNSTSTANNSSSGVSDTIIFTPSAVVPSTSVVTPSNSTATPTTPSNSNPNNNTTDIRNMYVIIFVTVPISLVVIGVLTIVFIHYRRRNRVVMINKSKLSMNEMMHLGDADSVRKVKVEHHP